jgi:hypothetical protein
MGRSSLDAEFADWFSDPPVLGASESAIQLAGVNRFLLATPRGFAVPATA